MGFNKAFEDRKFMIFYVRKLSNLIYGWNYSGKTTLSRIFHSFELKDFSSGFESSEFEN